MDTNSDGPALLRRPEGMKPTWERGRPARTGLGTASFSSSTCLDGQRSQDSRFVRAPAVPAGRVAGCHIAGKLSGTERGSMRAGRPRSRVGLFPCLLLLEGAHPWRADHRRKKLPRFVEEEPRMNTNGHEYRWSTFGGTASGDEIHPGARASRPQPYWCEQPPIQGPSPWKVSMGIENCRVLGTESGRVGPLRSSGAPSAR